MESTASLAARHILAHRVPQTRPLFVAIQGPQGSGKTFLTRSLVSLLASPPHSLQLAVLSVDDLYLTHAGLVELAARHPDNPLWRGRGQPGTHDTQLGADILQRLAALSSQVLLPRFDKSKFNGEGDRAAEGVPVDPPVDVVILEGWCTGFYPLTREELDAKWHAVQEETAANPGGIIGRCMKYIHKENMEAVNRALCDYVRLWYGYFQVFIQIAAPETAAYEHIYTQEHDMKANNGGIGMTDEQVHSFVDRYIPGYHFFSKGITKGGLAQGTPPWAGKGLQIIINEQREPVGTTQF